MIRTPIPLALLLLAAIGCETEPTGAAEQMPLEVLATHPHDTNAFTQGLVYHDGLLYESTGRYGESDVRIVDPETGEVLRIEELAEDEFAEGLARVDDRLVQLTWKSRLAYTYDIETLEPMGSVAFDTDGWGLCYDGTHLYSTSGGSIVFIRDPVTLEAEGNIQVRDGVSPQDRVNELECVGEYIYANVWRSTMILKIRKDTGEVVTTWDAAALVPEDLRGDDDAVLNGIAWVPERGTFYITGKLWPVLYEVRLNGG